MQLTQFYTLEFQKVGVLKGGVSDDNRQYFFKCLPKYNMSFYTI